MVAEKNLGLTSRNGQLMAITEEELGIPTH